MIRYWEHVPCQCFYFTETLCCWFSCSLLGQIETSRCTWQTTCAQGQRAPIWTRNAQVWNAQYEQEILRCSEGCLGSLPEKWVQFCWMLISVKSNMSGWKTFLWAAVIERSVPMEAALLRRGFFPWDKRMLLASPAFWTGICNLKAGRFLCAICLIWLCGESVWVSHLC